MPRTLPMFPLGSVLFPHMLLPLHVFEPRYVAMLTDVLAADREFGVTLIRRGHEVGGGDERFDVGTVARVLQVEELDDGRWLVLAIGMRRLRVVDWLPDDPYPRATVHELAEPIVEDVDDDLAVVQRRLQRVLSLQSEIEDPVAPPDTVLHDQPAMAAYQAAALASLTPFDAQEVLEADDAGTRLALLAELLDAAADVLRFRLGQ